MSCLRFARFILPISLGEDAMDPSKPHRRCRFCSISKANGFKIIWEDEELVAFLDHKPASQHHILISPKKHFNSIRTLAKQDVAMVKRMAEKGRELLIEVDVSSDKQKMGFHIPPFNSVDHLHLHVQGLPYLSQGRAAKYPVSQASGKLRDKGFGWFVEVDQAIKILEKGKRVGICPC